MSYPDDTLEDEGDQPQQYNVKFGEGVSDDDLIKQIDQWIVDSRNFHDLMLIQQNKCERYYLGTQTDNLDVPPYSSDTIYNRIFEGTETIIPIITGSAHQFLWIPGSDNELALKKAQKGQKVLTNKYETLEIQRHLEDVSRAMILMRFGVMKWYWDTRTDDVAVKTIDPRLIVIPKLRLDANDLPYVIELQEYTRGEIEEFFPDVDPDDLIVGRHVEGFAQTYDIDVDIAIYQIIECWTPEYVVWKQSNKVLKKMPNPYFDFEGVEEQTVETKQNGKVKELSYKRYYNHLPYPKTPYVFFNPFVTNDAPISQTSLAETALPIQDAINVQKRQIINNLVRMGNGQVYVDSDAISQEDLDQITSEPGLVIQGKNLASENRIRREPGTPLPAAHFSNLQDSMAAFDNVFGIHGATRGASTSSTLGGQILDRNQDVSRIEALTRVLNRGVSHLANGLVQMMKLYYDEEHVERILGREGAVEFIKFTQDDIEDGAVIRVKDGTPVQLDPTARFNQAVQLWQLGALDPETLFERLDFPDPQAAAQKLAAWKGGNLLLESQLRQNEARAAAEASAVKTGAGIAPPGQGSGTEGALDVIRRARESIHKGSAPPINRTPKGGQEAAIA